MERSSFKLALGAVTSAWLLFSSPWLMGHGYIPFDALDQFYPQSLFNARSLLEGEAPLWNPYTFCGFSNVGDPQSLVFSPLFNLVMTAGLSSPMHAFQLAVFLHVLIGGLGIALCGRDRGTSHPMIVIAAIVYMFGGVAASRLQHTPMILGYAFLPLAYCLLARTLDAPRLGQSALLGLSGALILVHGTQVTYLAGLFLAGLVVFNVSRLRWAQVANLSFSAVVALALAAPFLYAVATSVGLSNRTRIPYEAIVGYGGSLHPAALFTFLMPDYGGAQSGTPWVGELTSTYFYLGILPLLFLTHHCRQQPLHRGIRYERIYLPLALLFFVLYAAGPALGFYRVLYDALAGVNLFRRPNDAMFLVNAILALLLLKTDSMSLDVFLSRVQRLHPRITLLLPAALLLIVCGWIFFQPGAGYFGHASRFVLVFALLAILLAYAARHRRALWLLPLFALLDITQANSAQRFNKAAPEYAHDVFSVGSPSRLSGFLRDRLSPQPGAFPYRIEHIEAWKMWRNVPMIERMHATLGYNPLVDARYTTYYGAPESGGEARRTDGSGFNSPYFRLLGARFVLTGADLAQMDVHYGSALTGPIAEIDNTRIYEVNNPFARVLNPRKAIVTDNELRLPDFDPAEVVEIDRSTIGDTETGHPHIDECTGRVSYSLLEYTNNTLAVSFAADSPAWFVLSDTYHPWWRARVDGKRIPLYRANKAFRAVCLPGGSGVLRMSFGYPVLQDWLDSYR